MTEDTKRGRPRKEPVVEQKQEPVMRKRKSIVGTSMPWVAPEQQPAYGAMLGYRSKAKKSRPVVQPNPV